VTQLPTNDLKDEAAMVSSPGPRRRSVLRGIVTAGALGATGSVTGLPVGAEPAVAAGTGPAVGSAAGADVLVVITLTGGFDGLSAVVPVDDENYRSARPTLAVPADRLARLNGEFGLSPALHQLHRWWREGSLAVVQAVGQPRGSRSHVTASAALQAGGWLDRALGHPPTPWSTAYRGAGAAPGALGRSATGFRTAADFDLTGLTGTARSRWLAGLGRLAAAGTRIPIWGPGCARWPR
jgi:uncharacterized protein (DUF1501 family)